MKPIEYMIYNIEYNDYGICKCINIVGKSFDEVLKSFEIFNCKKGYKIISVNLRATGYAYI